MGFRHPLTSSRRLQTADRGARIVIEQADGAGRYAAHTGDPQQAAPGRFTAGVIPGETSAGQDQGFMAWRPPQIGDTVLAPEAGLLALGQRRDGASRGGWQLTGSLSVSGPLAVGGKLTTPGDTAWTDITPLNDFTAGTTGFRYRKLHDLVTVTLNLSRSTAWTAPITLGNLPAEVRPASAIWESVTSGGVPWGELRATPGGDLILSTSSSGGRSFVGSLSWPV